MIAFDSFSAPVVGSLLVRVTAVLALSWLGARIAARGSASMRHALWVAAFVGVLALPLAARFMPSLELPLLPAPEQTPLPAPAAGADDLLDRGATSVCNADQPDTVHCRPRVPASAPETPRTSWLSTPRVIASLGWALIGGLPLAIGAGLAGRYLLGLAIVARITRRQPRCAMAAGSTRSTSRPRRWGS